MKSKYLREEINRKKKVCLSNQFDSRRRTHSENTKTNEDDWYQSAPFAPSTFEKSDDEKKIRQDVLSCYQKLVQQLQGKLPFKVSNVTSNLCNVMSNITKTDSKECYGRWWNLLCCSNRIGDCITHKSGFSINNYLVGVRGHSFENNTKKVNSILR